MSLRSFAHSALGLRCDQVQGDLDQQIASSMVADRIASITGTAVEEIAKLQPSRQWLCTSWNSATRNHTAPIFICPDCLAGEAGHSRNSWRTKLAAVCPVHGRYLVGSCGRCGEVIRYQLKLPGAGWTHWMDMSPLCSACYEPIESGEMAPDRLVVFAAAFEKALAGERFFGMESKNLRSLSERIWTRCKAEPDVIRAIASNSYFPLTANYFALIGIQIVAKLLLRAEAEQKQDNGALMRFVLSMPFSTEAVVHCLESH
jgi:hypothetical protein